MDLLTHLLHTLVLTMRDVLPIIGVVFGFQLLVIRRPIKRAGDIVLGFLYVIFGMTLFLVGLEEALFPLGKLMAAQLTNPEFLYDGASVMPEVIYWTHFSWVYVFAAALGFSTTIAEPALIAVAIKANEVSGGTIGVWGLRLAVALGVAVGVALGVYRIVTGLPLHYFILTGYLVVVIQTLFAPRLIIGLAYDSGGVTTSTVTVPLVAALGLGLATGIPGRNPVIDGFGLIAFASLFPMMTVMAYAQLTEWLELRRNARIKKKR